MSFKFLPGVSLLQSNNKHDGEHGSSFLEAVKRELYLCGVFVPSDTIPGVEKMDLGGYLKDMKQTAKETDGVIRRWLEEHVEKMRGNCGGEADDFMDVMLMTLPEGEFVYGRKREDIVKATIMNLILTASESTSVTIIWAISLLLNNPSKLKAAQEELDSKVGRDKIVEEEDIKNLNYLQAVVKETMRLYPPGPIAGPREATEDCYIGKYLVPKGTRIIINLWKLHRDPQLWAYPSEFRPERFLEEHADTDFTGQHFYIPFSSGRRMCPAMTLGLKVVQMTLARLLHGFNMSTVTGKPVDMKEGLGLAVPKVEPLEVLISVRNHC